MALYSKNFPTLIKHFVISILIGIAASGIFCGKNCFTDWNGFLIGASYGGMLSFLLWEGNGLLSNWLSQKFPWAQKTLARFLWGIITTILFSSSVVALWHYVFFVLFMGNSHAWYAQVFVSNVVIALIITSIISLFLHAAEFLKGWREAALKAERLQHMQVKSRLQSLKDQLNPHFLFNSLHVLTALVHKDADLAEQFINKLADIYRYVLEQSQMELVPLSEELAFIEKYLELLRYRFGDNLHVSWNPPDAQGLYVPPLSLQLLVENVVKHNIISQKKPLTISVLSDKEGYLTIENNFQEKRTKTASTGIGMDHIRSLYAYLSNKEVIVDNDGHQYKVHIPLLPAHTLNVQDALPA